MLTKINSALSKSYCLFLLMSCVALLSHGQAVDENFDGYVVSGPPSSHPYGEFYIVNGHRTSTNARSGRAVHLESGFGTDNLTYVGTDGNGKDGGVGTISFWFKGSPSNPGFPPFVPFIPASSYTVQISVNGAAFNTISGGTGSNPIINYNDYGAGYHQWTYTLNNPNDNIRIRINKNASDLFFIDDFQITNFNNTCTWDGTNWSPAAPTLTEPALINGNYNTSIVTNGETSFSALNLTVNSSYELIIADGDYVEVQNNITSNGNITVKTSGALVQINNSGSVSGTGTMKVEKVTSTLATANEYTYWSSPVAGATISNGLSEANFNRVYTFNAQNFSDSSGDDINDGPNPDWEFVSNPSSTVMAAGVGYAAMHSNAAFTASQPNGILYTFEGRFNNGVFNVPIYRNDAVTTDSNWNFIGNPYPSAIDADLFLDANSSLDDNITDSRTTNGAIYLWSHDSEANIANVGNEVYNYAQSDYAIINGTGQTSGGDGITPSRYIPSGQGFFVSMSDGASCTVHSGDIKTTDVVFNNSMRSKDVGANDQFFRTAITDQPNKLWVNLTSVNGVFNQVLVGYVEGATDAFDGSYFDAPKNLSSALNASIYTLIETDPDKRFAIQGKNPSSLNLTETIALGFKTAIDVPTIYTFSVFKTEGEFMTENPVYLKDNVLGTVHNLSANDYNFSSEVGEFNNRFEIVFTPEALSIKDNLLDPNDLLINELNNGEVAFEVAQNLNIAKVAIFDLSGRQMYNLQGSNSREVYNLANLSNAVYIAKVTLSNGQVLSKKAIKQR